MNIREMPRYSIYELLHYMTSETLAKMLLDLRFTLNCENDLRAEDFYNMVLHVGIELAGKDDFLTEVAQLEE